MIGIDPFDMTSPAQGLQATNMGAHISLGVLALALKTLADTFQVRISQKRDSDFTN
jgi:hypothetical protein